MNPYSPPGESDDQVRRGKLIIPFAVLELMALVVNFLIAAAFAWFAFSLK